LLIRRFLACFIFFVLAANAVLVFSMPIAMAAGSLDDSTFAPTGTMLLPLTPKLDSSSKSQTSNSQSTSTSSQGDFSGEQSENASSDHETASKISTDSDELLPSLESISTEKGKMDQQGGIEHEAINEDSTLKGTVQIIADDTEYDQDKNTFLGTGNAIAVIGGQNSKLEADSILYDQNNQMIDARGNVKILRRGTLTTGSAFKFKVTSDEYLITRPDTSIDGTEIIARKGMGNKDGLHFQDGTLSYPVPFYFAKNYNSGPMSFREEVARRRGNPDAYLPSKQSFKFKAKKMVYERYKEEGNLTVFGGRIEFGDFSIPTGPFVCTVGQTVDKVVLPITPYIGTNMNIGGMNIGPQFNQGIGKDSVLSWSPMLQFGGRNLAAGGTNTSNLGVAGRVAFGNSDFQSHLAYGSVTNMLVADLKTKVWRATRLQAGINRYLNDGMLGMDRARAIAELVDNEQFTHLPLLASLNFRTSAGWAQDNPQLINVTAAYAKLYGNVTSTKITSAYRAQEQITATSKPMFSFGDDKWGIKSFLFAGAALRGYSTNQASLIGQFGPTASVNLNRLRFMAGYTLANVSGSSPFVFDEYVQGSQSTYIQGDYKIGQFVTLGGLYGYSLSSKLPYAEQIQAAIGPKDFKFIVGTDVIRNNYKFGFDMLYGAPIPFNKLVLKGSPDQGQLGGI
jgi:hypothetical protein